MPSSEYRLCRVQVLKMHHEYKTGEMRHVFTVDVVFLNIADREENIPLEEFALNDQIFLKMNMREPIVTMNAYDLHISAKWLTEHSVPDGAWKRA